MKISIDEIPQSPKETSFSENIGDLNALYSQSEISDFGFPAALDVDLTYYRSGPDLFFHGRFRGQFSGRCGRCSEQYRFALNQEFAFVLVPAPKKAARGAEELSRDELGLSYYAADEIDLAPLINEQVLLALPTRPLCSEGCRGLCGSCGVNLNDEECACSAIDGDLRMALFRTLKLGR